MALSVELLPRRDLAGQTALGQQSIRANSLPVGIVFFAGRRRDWALARIKMVTLFLHEQFVAVEELSCNPRTLA